MMKRESKHNHPLFDYIIEFYALKTNNALAYALGVDAPVISRIRVGKETITAKLILSIYDYTDLSIEEIRRLLK